MPKQNYENINKWKAEKTDRIQILPRKEEHIPERIQMAIDAGKSASRQAYIIKAIERALENDGIPSIKEDPDE